MAKKFVIEKASWTRTCIYQLRDQPLRLYTGHVYQAIMRKCHYPNLSAMKVSKFETQITTASRKTLDRYKELISVPGGFKDMIPNEHKHIIELLVHLLNQAMTFVVYDKSQQEIMGNILTEFENLTQ